MSERWLVPLPVRFELVALMAVCGCGRLDPELPPDVRINEVVSDNEGVWVDELGETDDYIELFNASSEAKNLADYVIVDRGGERPLPAFTLLPGARQLFWADNSPEQGLLHLPFGISSTGEFLRLARADGVEVDRVNVPALAEHHAFARQPDGSGAFVDCSWATPGRANGSTCGPGEREEPPDDVMFAPYDWPSPWPELPAPLALTEVALRPARFVELSNTSREAVDLARYELWIAPHRVGDAWPGAADGVVLALPRGELAPGERAVVDVSAADVAAIAATPSFEGVVTLVRTSDEVVLDRVDFSSWPAGAFLAKWPDPSGRFRFCADATPARENTCEALASRAVGDHERRLSTPDDFPALAAARRAVGIESVEFVLDMASGDVVTFLNSEDWDLHYTFVREVIDQDPHLDRCDPVERELFNQGWYAFSASEYFKPEGRRYLLGTLVRHGGTGLSTLEFTSGDAISAEQIKHAFFSVVKNVSDPEAWALRPQSPDQVERLREIEGQVPIVSQDAPFRDVTFQALTPGIAFGMLRFVPADELRQTAVGPRDIVVTDQVPNDIPLIGGLVTEAFQTPLAHVNILSRGRGTPNMALKNARSDPRLAAHFGQVVRLEVVGAGFTLERADLGEALAFWESREPAGSVTPRLDAETRGVVPLSGRTLADLPTVGGKAAQVAELLRVPFCSGPISVPEAPFAIALIHSLEHYRASGASGLLDALLADERLLADPIARARELERIRARVRSHPVDGQLLAEVEAAISELWPGRPLRFRSSSNTEDLPGFSGAGLYSSEGLDAENVPAEVEAAIREVWASLWTLRGFDEREYSGVEQRAVAMGVLVHPAYRSERVNGVAVSRDALEPTRGDRYYVNAQIGEALVTNPAPGIDSEEITYDPYRPPYATYHSRSSFAPQSPVMTQPELAFLACNLAALHEHFRPLLDPAEDNPWFAVDIEFKLMGPERALVIKQARSYSFGEEVPTGWCDF